MLLCDIMDKEDGYELQVEVQGIEKDKIDIKAAVNEIEISGKRFEDVEEKKKDCVYKEKFLRSFFKMLLPDEVGPSKISARMKGSIPTFELPKKVPLKSMKVTRMAIK